MIWLQRLRLLHIGRLLKILHIHVLKKPILVSWRPLIYFYNAFYTSKSRGKYILRTLFTIGEWLLKSQRKCVFIRNPNSKDYLETHVSYFRKHREFCTFLKIREDNFVRGYLL